MIGRESGGLSQSQSEKLTPLIDYFWRENNGDKLSRQIVFSGQGGCLKTLKSVTGLFGGRGGRWGG